MSFISFCRRIGVLPAVSYEQIAEAETENAMRDHDKAVERVFTSSQEISRTSGKLRESIRRGRSPAFAELERSIGGHHG